MRPAESIVTARLRTRVQGGVALGLIGVATELALIEHYESPWQLVPFGAVGVALLALAWHRFSPRRTPARFLQTAMLILLGGGAAGSWLHFEGSRAFQLESDPGMSGLTVLTKVMRATAPPVLAPFSMGVLGLFGLASLYRAPVLEAGARETTIGGEQ